MAKVHLDEDNAKPVLTTQYERLGKKVDKIWPLLDPKYSKDKGKQKHIQSNEEMSVENVVEPPPVQPPTASQPAKSTKKTKKK